MRGAQATFLEGDADFQTLDLPRFASADAAARQWFRHPSTSRRLSFPEPLASSGSSCSKALRARAGQPGLGGLRPRELLRTQSRLHLLLEV
ncbi:MAG: hypothetical protein JO191_12095 [Mycobacteriaceae bacterium]|nr:hypothetical protein [Mycobacteriaceae bacterium]